MLSDRILVELIEFCNPTRGPGGKITTFIGEKSPIKVVLVYLIVRFCTQFRDFNRLYRVSKRGPSKKVVILTDQEFLNSAPSPSPPTGRKKELQSAWIL